MSAHILVVDDEPGIRSGVREILLLEGYEVDVADCGRAAQDLISSASYDIVLIDYRLPDIDGLTLLQLIRKALPNAMTCMITAYANIETAIYATRQGIDLFLPKPFAPNDLLGAVGTLLGHKKLRDEAERLRSAHAASLQELASEKSQTHSLVASLRDGVLVVNRDGDIALANRSMEEILGVHSGELLGKQVSKALADGVLSPALAAFDPENPSPAVFEADLPPRRLFVTVSGFYDDEGKPLGRIVTAVDISAVKRLALEKARFTRTLVHELRAPLGALKSIVEVLQDRSMGNALESYDTFLSRANERIDGLSELISDLLSLSRIEHEGANKTPAAPSNVGAVISEIIGLWRDRAATASVRIEANLAPDIPLCAIAPDDLRTVLTNLVGNAVKYNRPGGLIAVSATSRETKGVEGNGLGLAIVKRLIERAGGRLQISSELGAGSQFRAIFPG
jgi:signal transduction histidine kinase